MFPPFLVFFLIRSFEYLQVMRTCIKSRMNSNFDQIGQLVTELAALFDQIIIKVAGNQDRHKSSDEFDFGPLVSMAHLYVFEMRSDLGTLNSGERSLPFGLLVMTWH